MSFNYVLHAVKTALLVAPLLAGCGNNGGGTTTVPTGGINLNCSNPGSLLDPSGNCVTPPAGNLTVTASCTSTQALSTKDGVTTYCVEKGNGVTTAGLTARINQDQTSITNLKNQLTQVSSAGGKAYYVGVTNLAGGGTKGVIIDAQSTTQGLVGAAAICSAQFGAGAHMCSVMEMYDSVANADNPPIAGKPDQFNPATNSAGNAWVYMEGWNKQTAAPTDPTAGLNENCAGYLYGTGDQSWQGTVVNWTAGPPLVLRFNISGCATANQIACCK
jgi:hypothetical protein